MSIPYYLALEEISLLFSDIFSLAEHTSKNICKSWDATILLGFVFGHILVSVLGFLYCICVGWVSGVATSDRMKYEPYIRTLN